MDYQSFKDHITQSLWKRGDADLIASLDNLIAMADSNLSRKLAISRRETYATLLSDVPDIPLPLDFQHMIHVSNSRLGAFRNVTGAMIATERAALGGATLQTVYNVSGKTLKIVGDSATQPEEIDILYRASIPDFKTTDASWLADEYLDLYTYAVLLHSGPFLREDERVILWKGMYDQAMTDILEEDAFSITYGGSPLDMTPARHAP